MVQYSSEVRGNFSPSQTTYKGRQIKRMQRFDLFTTFEYADEKFLKLTKDIVTCDQCLRYY